MRAAATVGKGVAAADETGAKNEVTAVRVADHRSFRDQKLTGKSNLSHQAYGSRRKANLQCSLQTHARDATAVIEVAM